MPTSSPAAVTTPASTHSPVSKYTLSSKTIKLSAIMTNIAVFASGSGTNAVNLVKAFNSGSRIRVAICLVDRKAAPVIEKMEALGVPVVYYPRSVWKTEPQVILDTLAANDIQLIALAGFLCIVPDEIVRAYPGRILNIHPSLLPAFGGIGMHGANVHKAVIEAGEIKSGPTVHIVTEEVDNGPIVLQKEVPVLPGDTPETLEARVHEAEYEIFPQAVVKVISTLTPPPVPESVDTAWAKELDIEIPPIPSEPSEISESTEPSEPSMPWMSSTSPNLQTSTPSTPMPPTYLVWSVVMTILCCFVPGIVAIIMSSKVSSRYYAGDIEGAQRASRNAEIWIIISFVLGVISSTLYLPLAIAGWL